MKKITVLAAALVFGLGITSCSKDDDNNEVAQPVLAGKWEFSKQGAIVSGMEAFTDYPNTAGCSKDYVLLNADNTFADVLYDKEDGVCVEDKDPGVYTVVNNVITLDYNNDDYSEKLEVLSITATELKLRRVATEEGEIQTVYVLTRG